MTTPCRSRGKARIALLAILGLAVAGCANVRGYMGYWERHRELVKGFHEEASARALRELHPGDCILVVGDVSTDRPYPGSILILAVTDTYRRREIVIERVLQPPVNYYQAFLPEGTYDLYFFADIDGNGYFDADEMVGRTSGEPVRIDKKDIKDGLTFDGPPFALKLNSPAESDVPVKVQVREQAYAFATLDDPFFDPRYGLMGLYEPTKLLAHTQRFLFSLETFDPRKTIVVFVHGIEGTPRDFKYLVEGLDRARYQPWFYFYPTGMPLQKLGSLLAETIKLANRAQTYKLGRVVIVAHSMGGLVSLSALNELCADGVPAYLKAYVSFDTPYGGVESARKAEKLPVAVPSWTDIATGSPFLEDLYRGGALKKIPFYLFFGYRTGDSSDGTITLQSQLDARIHLNASRSYGFNTSHMGILNDPASLELFNSILDSVAQKQ